MINMCYVLLIVFENASTILPSSIQINGLYSNRLLIKALQRIFVLLVLKYFLMPRKACNIHCTKMKFPINDLFSKFD